MKICPFCAEEIQDAAIVCKHCRRDLTGKTPVIAVHQVDWISTFARWSAGILLAVFLLAMFSQAC